MAEVEYIDLERLSAFIKTKSKEEAVVILICLSEGCEKGRFLSICDFFRFVSTFWEEGIY